MDGEGVGSEEWALSGWGFGRVVESVSCVFEADSLIFQLDKSSHRSRKRERYWLLPLKLKELMENLHAISIYF